MDTTTKTTAEGAAGARDGKAAWDTPTLIVHGGFEELTRFTSGTGPDDGFFDPGAASSQA
jgi:hypothetical protein